jgi:hypothetical protein
MGFTESQMLAALDVLTGRTPPQVDAPLAARLRAENRRWISQPNLVGFGMARRVVASKPCDELALKIYVERKLPLVALEVPVPRELAMPWGMVPIDVEAIGRGRPHLRQRPAKGGSNISHVKGDSGTLGCLVRSISNPEQRFILSNAHVLALSGYAKVDDPIVQPAQIDGGKSPADVIATLSDWSRFNPDPGYPNLMDAAIAKIEPGAVEASIGDRPPPDGVGYYVPEGMEIRIWGAKSSFRSARVTDPHLRLSVIYKGLDGHEFSVGFREQVKCEVYAQEGDSGAAVLDGNGLVVGLHFFGGDDFSVFNPIKPILDRFAVDVVRASGASTGASAATALPPVAPTYLPPIGSRPIAIDTLARTVWGEARNQGDLGMQAVAAVVVNRTRRGTYAGWTVEGVCEAPFQFSCWNEDDPNRAKLKAVNLADPIFVKCLSIGASAVDGTLADPTSGATHYFVNGTKVPAWSVGKTPCVTIGAHLFFNNVA